MKNFYPYIYFWFAAISIIIFSEVPIPNISHVIDINSKDTYYIVSRREVGYVFGLLYFLLGFLYWLFKKLNINLNRNLTTFHTIVCIATVIIYYFFLTYYSINNNKNILETSKETVINLILVFTTVLMQVHFIYNIVVSLIKHFALKKKRNAT